MRRGIGAQEKTPLAASRRLAQRPPVRSRFEDRHAIHVRAITRSEPVSSSQLEVVGCDRSADLSSVRAHELAPDLARQVFMHEAQFGKLARPRFEDSVN